MSTEAYIYAEVRRGDAWHPAERASWGKPLEFGEEARNEVLFDVLGAPFAGYHSGGHFISKGRGLPEDVSPPIRRVAESMLEGRNERPANGVLKCHALGAGWVLAQEIFDFDWGKTIEVRRRVAQDVAKQFPSPDGSRPTWDWPESDSKGVEVTWQEPLSSWGFSADDLAKLRVYGSPDSVRVVFWFF